MFKSIQYVKYIGINNITNIYSYLFKIIDDDFEEEVVGDVPVAMVALRDPTGGAGAVITCYENKNLPVAKNLLRHFIFYEKQRGIKYYSIQKQIEHCIKYQTLFIKYKNEIEKYLSLI